MRQTEEQLHAEFDFKEFIIALKNEEDTIRGR